MDFLTQARHAGCPANDNTLLDMSTFFKDIPAFRILCQRLGSEADLKPFCSATAQERQEILNWANAPVSTTDENEADTILNVHVVLLTCGSKRRQKRTAVALVCPNSSSNEAKNLVTRLLKAQLPKGKDTVLNAKVILFDSLIVDDGLFLQQMFPTWSVDKQFSLSCLEKPVRPQKDTNRFVFVHHLLVDQVSEEISLIRDGLRPKLFSYTEANGNIATEPMSEAHFYQPRKKPAACVCDHAASHHDHHFVLGNFMSNSFGLMEEEDNIEFKEVLPDEKTNVRSWPAKSNQESELILKAAHFVAAVINARMSDPSADIFFGVTDKGYITGVQLKDTDVLTMRISNMLHQLLFSCSKPNLKGSGINHQVALPRYHIAFIPAHKPNCDHEDMYVIRLRVDTASGYPHLIWTPKYPKWAANTKSKSKEYVAKIRDTKQSRSLEPHEQMQWEHRAQQRSKESSIVSDSTARRLATLSHKTGKWVFSEHDKVFRLLILCCDANSEAKQLAHVLTRVPWNMVLDMSDIPALHPGQDREQNHTYESPTRLSEAQLRETGSTVWVHVSDGFDRDTFQDPQDGLSRQLFLKLQALNVWANEKGMICIVYVVCFDNSFPELISGTVNSVFKSCIADAVRCTILADPSYNLFSSDDSNDSLFSCSIADATRLFSKYAPVSDISGKYFGSPTGNAVCVNDAMLRRSIVDLMEDVYWADGPNVQPSTDKADDETGTEQIVQYNGVDYVLSSDEEEENEDISKEEWQAIVDFLRGERSANPDVFGLGSRAFLTSRSGIKHRGITCTSAAIYDDVATAARDQFERKTPQVVSVCVDHERGAGATTMCRFLVWRLRNEFPVFVLKSEMNREAMGHVEKEMVRLSYQVPGPFVIIVDKPQFQGEWRFSKLLNVGVVAVYVRRRNKLALNTNRFFLPAIPAKDDKIALTELFQRTDRYIKGIKEGDTHATNADFQTRMPLWGLCYLLNGENEVNRHIKDIVAEVCGTCGDSGEITTNQTNANILKACVLASKFGKFSFPQNAFSYLVGRRNNAEPPQIEQHAPALQQLLCTRNGRFSFFVSRMAEAVFGLMWKNSAGNLDLELLVEDILGLVRNVFKRFKDSSKPPLLQMLFTERQSNSSKNNKSKDHFSALVTFIKHMDAKKACTMLSTAANTLTDVDLFIAAARLCLVDKDLDRAYFLCDKAYEAALRESGWKQTQNLSKVTHQRGHMKYKELQNRLAKAELPLVELTKSAMQVKQLLWDAQELDNSNAYPLCDMGDMICLLYNNYTDTTRPRFLSNEAMGKVLQCLGKIASKQGFRAIGVPKEMEQLITKFCVGRDKEELFKNVLKSDDGKEPCDAHTLMLVMNHDANKRDLFRWIDNSHHPLLADAMLNWWDNTNANADVPARLCIAMADLAMMRQVPLSLKKAHTTFEQRLPDLLDRNVSAIDNFGGAECVRRYNLYRDAYELIYNDVRLPELNAFSDTPYFALLLEPTDSQTPNLKGYTSKQDMTFCQFPDVKIERLLGFILPHNWVPKKPLPSGKCQQMVTCFGVVHHHQANNDVVVTFSLNGYQLQFSLPFPELQCPRFQQRASVAGQHPIKFSLLMWYRCLYAVYIQCGCQQSKPTLRYEQISFFK